MKIVQGSKIGNQPWVFITENQRLNNPLVLIFANRYALENEEVLADIRTQFPYEHLVFGSTCGEIIGKEVTDNSIAVTAIEFEKSSFKIVTANVLDFNKKAKNLGKELFDKIPKSDLKHFFVLSEGSFVNGSSLIEGIENKLYPNLSITGGLCGDDDRFEKTLASYKDNPKEGEVVLIGFYGNSLEISFASFGGWLPFGPERKVTRAKSNILFEIDDQPALDLYKKYLGEKASKLPQASLLYPLNVTPEGTTEPVVRTILKINENNNSMILAGDVPVNSRVQLMMAAVDGIVAGAERAAELAMKNRKTEPQLAILVSCIGRKLVLNQRVEEEIEQVQEILGNHTAICGFYSYGEIAPFNDTANCQLHNQTMTLTLISE
ncbi:FIST N-terminal domain-containing protein [Flavobacterium sp.]|uniref:FIST signal transduction protein n=1 Tax=Flavobacterium sp. TaxID=239 RepID=UPI0026265DA6|nr:FIST N-terminal domain-containing protein [Flavobacterium sp.]